MLGINLSLARRTMLRQLGWAADYDGATENLQITNPRNVYSGEYSLKADFANDVVGQAPAGWTTQSGEFKVKNVNPSPFGSSPNYNECTSAGVAFVPCNQTTGKWEFDYFKGNDAQFSLVQFISDKPVQYPAFNGYSVFFRSDESIKLQYWNSITNTDLAITQASYISPNTWYKIRIERLTNGQFTFWIKGGAFADFTLVSVSGGGSNPATNNNVTSSNYFVFHSAVGDRIANIQCEIGTGSFDLSGHERIFHSGNRDFETPVGLGPELIVNGSFNSNLNYWVPFGSDSSMWEDGRAKITGNNEGRKQSIATTPGKLYQLSGKFQKGSVLGSVAAAGNVPFVRNLTSITNDPFAYYFTADASVTEIRLYTSAGLETDYCYFDEISVKEVLSDWQGSGNHSCYVTGEEKKSGSFCLKMISSGAGDALNNYIELPASKFRILQNGDKYTIDGPFARGTGILGNNLITNGNFANWTGILPNEIPVGWSVSPPDANNYVSNASGACRFVSNGSYIAMSQNMLVIGKTYEASVNVTSVVSGTIVLTRGTSLSADEVLTINSTGLKTVRFVATGTALHIKRTTACDITLDDIVVKEVTLPTLNIVIGGKQKATTGISCIPGTFTKLVHNFECTEAEVNQPIKIFCNQADTVYLDDTSFPQAFDGALLVWKKQNAINTGAIQWLCSGYSASSRTWDLDVALNTTPNFYFGDGSTIAQISGGVNTLNTQNYQLIAVTLNRTSNGQINIDGINSGNAVSISQIGRVFTPLGLFIGRQANDSIRYFNGKLGEIQFVRFNNINLSDFDATKYFKSQIPRKYSGGGALVTLHMKFKGPDDATFLKDYSPLQQLVTGINVTKAGDQVRGAYPYYSR